MGTVTFQKFLAKLVSSLLRKAAVERIGFNMDDALMTNIPIAELNRSLASQRVGELARSSALFLSHFEQRAHLPIPESWMPDERPELVPGPHWEGGAFTEHKFRHFRYDNPIGSFNPAHRGKWTAHELCHALVGFAWAPDATPFFHSLTARLAEVLPVALWYFFDEADLRRCEEHQGGGALFGTYCSACERAAQQGPQSSLDERWYERGREYVMGELAAVARSRRLGRPVGHRYATLDLNTDSLAWTSANRHRLASPEFAWYRELFLTAEHCAFATLDELEGRVIEVMDALTGRGDATPLAGNRWLWMAQDVGWRLLNVIGECDGELVTELEALVEGLAASPDEPTLAAVRRSYDDMCGEWFLPPADEVFALGYPSPCGSGIALGQVIDGVEHSLPNTAALLGDALEPVVQAFAEQPTPTRGPLAHRFARFLHDAAPGPTADVARYEAAIGQPAMADAVADALSPRDTAPDADWTVAQGVEVLPLETDVAEVINRIDDLPEILPERPHHLAIRRTSSGDVIVAEVSSAAAEYLTGSSDGSNRSDTPRLTPLELRSLRDLGLLVPRAYAVFRSDS